VQVYLDFARALIESADEWSAEQGFHLEKFHAQFYGTCDLVVYKPEKAELHIADYKHGKGVAVEVIGNPQLRYYALGAATRHHNRAVKKIVIHVVQPRCPHNDGPIRSETVAPADLLEWSADLVDAAEATAKPDAPLVAGDWCKFCRAAAICPALKTRALAVAQAEFDDEGEMTLPKPENLDLAALARVKRQADALETWIKAVQKYAHDLALQGQMPEGFKLVGTRPTRFFKDEDRVKKKLVGEGVDPKDLYGEPKFKSPAQMETTLAKGYGFKKKEAVAFLAPLVDAVSKNTVLVPLDDPRPPARDAAADEFEMVG
jgi:thiol-disulfide isomerase/thioredoxin